MSNTELDRAKLRELGHSSDALFWFMTYYGPTKDELATLGSGNAKRGLALVERVWREVEHDERYASDGLYAPRHPCWAVRVLGRSEAPA